MEGPSGPLFKWFGSKWLLSRHYPPLIWRTVIAPFAGGAGECLRFWHHKVHLWDTDPHLQKLWPWLIGPATSKDILAIPLNLPVGTDIREITSLDEGQKLLLKSWQRTNSVGNCWTISKWGDFPGQWTAQKRARVAYDIEFVKHWKFTPDVWQYPNGATYLIDPPYQHNYQYGQPPVDYANLALQISRLPAGSQVLINEALHPKTQESPTWLRSARLPDFQPLKKAVTSRRGYSSELLAHFTSPGLFASDML